MLNMRQRSRSAKNPRLRLLDLELPTEAEYGKENVGESNPRPYGGIKGSKKHPLSPYSFNKESSYVHDIQEDLVQMYKKEFNEDHRSQRWAVESSKEITHNGESPLILHGLLSASRLEMRNSLLREHQEKPSVRGRSAPPKRNSNEYYRPNSTHQYLSATELRQTEVFSTDVRYGRPTRTTLLRERQRCNSTPNHAYRTRRDSAKRAESNQQLHTSKEYMHVNTKSQEESVHAFLTGARYNRAHLLDSKGLSVYGVYMPRTNPLACFMTGHASTRMKDRPEDTLSAPPETPRSDTSDVPEVTPETKKRPATAPGKRLLSAKVNHSRSRPHSAWGDASTSCEIVQNESEVLHQADQFINKEMVEEMILNPNGLNVQGNRVLVTLKTKQMPPKVSESKLPRVTGISVPKSTLRKRCDPVEETSIVNQPPPTPVGGLSRTESDKLLEASLSVKDNFTRDDLTNVSRPRTAGIDRATDTPDFGRDLEESGDIHDDEPMRVDSLNNTVEMVDCDSNEQKNAGKGEICDGKAQSTLTNNEQSFKDENARVDNLLRENAFFVTDGGDMDPIQAETVNQNNVPNLDEKSLGDANAHKMEVMNINSKRAS